MMRYGAKLGVRYRMMADTSPFIRRSSFVVTSENDLLRDLAENHHH